MYPELIHDYYAGKRRNRSFKKSLKTSCIYFIQDMLLSENVCAFQDPIKEHYSDAKG